MEALMKREFIRLSYKKKASRNPEKFYKITENGLKALLSVENLSPQEFWKAITLLCISSEGNNYESQFLEHYNHFENDFVGDSARRHLLPSWFFDDILRLWLDTNNIGEPTGNFRQAPLAQLIIESLAFNGPMGLKGLVDDTGAKEEDIVRVLNSYSIKPGDFLKFNLQSQDKIDIRKKIYEDFTSRLLIYTRVTSTETTYELSIFGAMLAIALIRYCYKNLNNTLLINAFTYKDKKTEEYYEKLAFNYKEKLPLIFERWSLLRSRLGSLLYNSFDFLIFEEDRSNIRDTSVWFGGNKEFYDEVRNMAQSTHIYEKLFVIHAIGKDMIQKYQQYEFKLLPLRKKIIEIDAELFIIRMLSSLVKRIPSTSQHLELSEDSIKKIEELFVEEVSFFFYLNLNTYKLTSKCNLFINILDLNEFECDRPLLMNETEGQLGSPKQRLMALLSKDNTIREWFSKQTMNILSYRNQVSEKMSEFSNQITKPQKYKRSQEATTKESKKNTSMTEFIYEEYDITKICSDVGLPYEY